MLPIAGAGVFAVFDGGKGKGNGVLAVYDGGKGKGKGGKGGKDGKGKGRKWNGKSKRARDLHLRHRSFLREPTTGATLNGQATALAARCHLTHDLALFKMF